MISLILFLLSLYVTRAEESRFNLFSKEMKRVYPMEVYDFIERYLFQLDSIQRTDGLYMSQFVRDDVRFVVGTVENCQQITPETSFTLSLTNNRYYEAVWRNEDESILLDLVFPASYELIYGLPKHKIERTMERQLKAMSKFFITKSIPVDIEVVQLNDTVWKRNFVTYHEIEEINDAIYFEYDNISKLVPLFDIKYPLYSAYNILQGYVENIGDYRLYIEQSVYEFETLHYTVSLVQWLNYCQYIHGKIYLGLEEEHEDGYLLLLLLVSPDLGFKHMLSLVVPRDFVTRPNAVLRARLHAYIPMHNVKAYYKEKELLKLDKK